MGPSGERGRAHCIASACRKACAGQPEGSAGNASRSVSPPPVSANARLGLAAAGGAYVIWGLLPLYLKALGFAAPAEILAQRILWSVPAALVAVVALRSGRATIKALRQPGVAWALTLSAVLIGANWGIYVWAVATDQVIAASLAYFISPLVNVAIGVAFFGERLRGRQGLAFAIGAGGVVLQAVALGAPPWVSLALTATWAGYAVVRKRAVVPAAGGLLYETAILAPIAAAGLLLLAAAGPLAIMAGPTEALLLAAAGPITALPLILFALGARRISFIALGLLQYIGPSLQLLIGVAFGEPFGGLRAASFVLIWAGLALFTWEQFRAEKRA